MSRLLSPYPNRKLDHRPFAHMALAVTTSLTLLITGCEPERPLKPVQTAQTTQPTKTASPSSVSPPARPQGPITVDKDGFVTLGPAVDVEPEASVQPSAPVVAQVPSSEAADTKGDQRLDRTPTQSIAARVSSSLESAANVGNESEKSIPALPANGSSNQTKKLDEKNQAIAENWPKPQALLFITGQQHGYIEPCGCTGLENQKGGLNRRDTLLTQLRDRGWDVVPMDVGNFERRTGIQAELKLQTSIKALTEMGYKAATLGVDDLRLSSQELLAMTASEGKTQTPFISANAYVLIEEYMPKLRIVESNGRKIGITAVLGDSHAKELATAADVIVAPAAESLRKVIAEMEAQKCDYKVLLSHATLAESRTYARDVAGFDLVVSAGDYPEPDFMLEQVEGSSSQLVQVGNKGMFTALVGLYPDGKPVRYQRVALSAQFADSPRMMKLFGDYQKQLQQKGFDGLRVPVQALEDGLKFVGSETCGDCHSKAFDVWKNSEHFTATESLVKPPNSRSMIPRHFDPECLSCHVTGWNPQRYYPYSSGFTSLEKTPQLTGNGCENCHGAGSAHVAAENGDTDLSEAAITALREKMRLPLAEAKERCIQCHDQDNSPDFHHEGAFEKYWEEIAHSGKD